MKKYKLFLLVTALIFAILGTAVAFAAPSATAKLDGPSAVRPGNAITLEFKLTSGEIYGLEADLSEAGPISRQSIVLNPELSGWEYIRRLVFA